MAIRTLVSKIRSVFSQLQAHTAKDYSLHSGERQTAIRLDAIRADHRYRYEKAIEIIKSRGSASMPLLGIDAFCANGYGSYMLSESLESAVLGVDASEEAIAQANQHFSTSKTFFCCKEFPFELPECSFDFATSIESVEHVKEYALLVSSLAKSLRKGGLLFISTPNEDVMPFNPADMPFHVKHFNDVEVVDLAARQNSLSLLASFGQDVYAYDGEKRCGLLAESAMKLHEGQGQFRLYVFEKKPIESIGGCRSTSAATFP